MEEPKELKFIFRIINEEKNVIGTLDHAIALAESTQQIGDFEGPVKSLSSFLELMMNHLAEFCKTKELRIENIDRLRREIAVELICLDLSKSDEITIDVPVSKEQGQDE